MMPTSSCRTLVPLRHILRITVGFQSVALHHAWLLCHAVPTNTVASIVLSQPWTFLRLTCTCRPTYRHRRRHEFFPRSIVTSGNYDPRVYMYTVSQKTVQKCFCQNFVKFTPILIIFGRDMTKRLKLCELHSFSILPNSHHHTTVLNAVVPNGYITL